MKNFQISTLLFFGLFNLGFLLEAQSQQTTSQSGYLPSSVQYYTGLPLVVPTPASLALTLPTEVDNSTQIFFPQKDNSSIKYMYDQTHQTASCQNVATAFFTYTYEVNRLRSLVSNTQETRYAPNFSFSHLNHGYAGFLGYTSLEKVQKFLQETGAMTDLDFDGLQQMDAMDAFRWHSGYDYYKNVFKNKLDYVRRFDFGIPWGQNGNPQVIQKLNDNLIALKHYLYDYAVGDANNGGVVTMGLNFDYNIANNPNGSTSAQLPPESAYTDEWVKKYKNYLHPGGHALTIVGYCDDVKFDWGGGGTYQEPDPVTGQLVTRFIPDGIFSNTKDNNGDGCINLEDYEIGAVKVANSYGDIPENEGFVWILYSYLAFIQSEWWGGNEFYSLTPKISNDAEVVFKVKIAAEKRDDLMFGYGYAPLANFPEPVDLQVSGGIFNHIYTGYYQDGGPFTILGLDKYQNPIVGDFEVLFDFNHFYKNTDYGKAFFINKNEGTSNAQIKYLSLIDYRWNEEFELPYEGNMPFNVLGTWAPSTVGIEYDLIAMGPQAPPISSNAVFEANMVSRFQPKVTNGSTLTVNNGVRIDMYNSTITIEQGSSLFLGDNVIIRAKRGDNKLIINGNLLTGQNVTFEAIEGASLDVVYESLANPVTFNNINCNFKNARLVIQSGILSINNSTLKFSSTSKIIVKQQSKLKLDASHLTNYDLQQWRGIEVWGSTYQNQFSLNGICAQGSIEIGNYTVIENAYNGITNWKPDDWNSIGGIIKAEGATFKNCRRGVEFMKYRNFNPTSGYEMDNLSYFRNCSFIVDDNYPANASPFYTGVSLWSVRGVKFSGCDFFNNKTVKGSGYGIHSLDAGYKIYAICNSQTVPCPDLYLDKTNIDGFEYGINASNAETYNTINVQNAVFTDNGYGIELLNVNNAVILDNHFEMASATNCPNYGIGINLVNCTGYAIEGNNFESDNIPTNYSWTGIETINSGQAYNEIYKNSYLNLTAGNVADLLNATTNTIPPTGLTYLCNTNTGNKYDFFVTNNADSRISYYQRSGSSTAAGNSFSPNASVNFFNEGASQVRYYYSTGMAPSTYSGIQLILTANANTCPSHYGGGSGIEVELTQSQADALESQYADAYSAYNNVKSIYETLKDGGSTQNTVEEIENSIPSEMWELRAKLLGDSPHLSQQALMEAALKTDVLPESVLFEILAANPDEMRDESFLSFLESKEYPLPSYMIDLLRAIAGNTSYKTVLQEQLNAFNTQKTLAASDIIRSKLNDSIISQTDIINWFDNRGDLNSRYQMVDAYLQAANYAAAQTMLTLIPGLHELSGSDSVDYQKVCELKNLQVNISSAGRNLAMLTNAEKEQLSVIADANAGIASTQAKGILEFMAGTPYCNCVKYNDVTKSSVAKPLTVVNLPSEIKISVTPNPATTWITFEYSLPEKLTAVTVTITDNSGRKVETLSLTGRQGQKVLDTRKYASGAYIYQCNQDRKVTGKFIIKYK